jgi:Cft2 family RNA processing exonuclease
MDHMGGFDFSKGNQTIVLSEPTKELLINEYADDWDLVMRSRPGGNIKSINTGQFVDLEGIKIQILSSGHMLGAVQVAVETTDGQLHGYSGDFNWPLEKVIQVDTLVVDSTYGSPERARLYSQEEVNTRFLQILSQQLVKTPPVHIKAHPGTLQRALELIDIGPTVPLVAPKKLCSEIQVYQRFGYNIPSPLMIGSEEAALAIESGRYIRLYSRGDGDLFGITDGTAINLSAFMAQANDPVLEFSDRSFSIAMTCHADFAGTLDYIKATGAKRVITDNSRSGHAVTLANEIQSRLGIEASPSEHSYSREWGK